MNPPVPIHSSAIDTQKLARLLRREDFAELRKRTKRALKTHPLQANLHAYAGAASFGLGDAQGALKHYAKACTLAPSNPQYVQNKGHVLQSLGDCSEALPCFIAAKQMGADDAALNHSLGLCLMHCNRLREALPLLARAVSQAPQDARYASLLAQAFLRGGLYENAQTAFELALTSDPNNGQLWLELARCHYQAGESQDALRVADKALSKGALLPEVQALRAAAFGSLGQVDKAKQASRAALQSQRNTSLHYYNFALRHDMRHEAEIVRILQDRYVDNSGDALAGFALAKAYDDLGEYQAGYDALAHANAMRRKDLAYDEDQELAQFEAIKTRFSSATAIEASTPQQGPSPIFILGMPRSGTTLIEAILARHRQITACGEVNALLQSVLSCFDKDAAESPEKAAQFANHYKARLGAKITKTPYFTDKMPENFRLIGHILTTMPKAQILHICRDPRAMAWSNFKTNFMSNRNGFCYDPDALVRYIQAYQDLIAFWHRQFPARIIDVDYDALAQSPQSQIPQLLTDLDLPWDADCLSPDKSAHAVTTASQNQVRRAIYTGSSAHWRNYAPYAGGWLSRLAPQGDTGQSPRPDQQAPTDP